MKNNIYKIKEIANSLQNSVRAGMMKTASVKIKKKSYTVYPFRILAVMLALIIVVMLVAAIIPGKSKSVIEIPFEAGSPYNVCPVGNDILAYNNRGARAIDESGRVKWSIDAALSEPMVDSADDYVLLCDLAGNHYAASYKNGKQIYEYKLGNDIISAKITPGGYAAFATDTDGYKGKVTLFNKRGRELYVWNSGGGYITDIDLTDNGRYIAAAQLTNDETEVSSQIRFIDSRRGEIVGTAERKGEVIVNIKYVADNKLIAVTDSNIIGYNKKGKELFCISLMGKSPSEYCIDGDKLIAVMTLDNRGNTMIEIYNYSGKLLGTYTATSGIRYMTVSGQRVVAAEQRGLVSINARGRVKGIANIEHDITAIGGFAGGDRVAVIGSMTAEVAKIK